MCGGLCWGAVLGGGGGGGGGGGRVRVGRVRGEVVCDSMSLTHPPSPEGGDPKGEEEAVAHAGQVEDSLSHNKPDGKEEVRGR